MAQATYLVDGVNLNDAQGRWWLDHVTTLPAVANHRVTSLQLPGRDGAIGVRQGLDVGHVGLSVTVDNPANPPSNIALLDEYVTAISAVLQGARTVTWAPGGGRLPRSVEVVDSVVSTPESEALPRELIIAAALTVQPYWREDAVLLTPAQPLTPGVIGFAEFAGVTGKLADAIVRVRGPLTGLTIMCGGTGVVFGAVLPASTYLYVDTASFRAWTSASASAWTGGTPATIDYPAGGPLQVWPTLAGDPLAMPVQLTIAGTGFTADSNISLRGRRWYL